MNTILKHRRKTFRTTTLSILFVVSNSSSPTSDETTVKTELENQGHTITLLSDESATGSETGYDAIVLTSDGSSAIIADTFLSNSIGVLDLDYATFVDMNFCNSVSNDTGEDSIDSINDSHPIAVEAGVSGTAIQVFNDAVSGANVRYTTNAGSGATSVFSSPGNSNRDTIFVFDTGATLSTGTAAGRRVAFGIGDSNSIEDFNSTGWDIFHASIKWVAGSI